METIDVKLNIPEGHTIDTVAVLRFNDKEYIIKERCMVLVFRIMKREIDEGRLLIAPGHENHFKRLMNGELTDESIS